MPYYNWGEQIGNSFMSMLNMNQQKQLEDKRLSLEERKLQDAMQTSALQRQAYELEMKRNQALYDEENAKRKWFASMPGRMADFDMSNGYNPDVSVPLQYWPEVSGSAYSEYDTNIFNQETNKFEPRKVYYMGDEAKTLLEHSMNLANQGFSQWSTNEQFKLDRQRNDISAQSNALQGEHNRFLRQQQQQENYGQMLLEVQKLVDEQSKIYKNWNSAPEYAKQRNTAAAMLANRYGVSQDEVRRAMWNWTPESKSYGSTWTEYGSKANSTKKDAPKKTLLSLSDWRLADGTEVSISGDDVYGFQYGSGYTKLDATPDQLNKFLAEKGYKIVRGRLVKK